MPYTIKQEGDGWLILKKMPWGGSTVIGRSDTKEEALASVRARWAAERRSRAAVERSNRVI